MTLDQIIRIREILIDLNEKLSKDRNPEFEAYNTKCHGQDRDKVIEGLESLGCIMNVEKRGLEGIKMTANAEAIYKALNNRSYDSL